MRTEMHRPERKSCYEQEHCKTGREDEERKFAQRGNYGRRSEPGFMAAAALAHTVADTSNGNRKKAEAIMTMAKVIIDALFESMWKREYGNAPAAEPVATADTAEKQDGHATAATAEKRNDPAACQPGNMDSMMEKIIADAMKQAKENPNQAQGVMFKVPAGDMPMEEVVKHIISAVDKQARKDQNGG